MSIKTVRRMAAEILKRGESAIWIDPDRMSDAASALTRDDVRALIMQGVVRARPAKGTSRARGRMHDELRRKGRRKEGSKKGHRKALQKNLWTQHTRAQRELLRQLKPALKPGAYRGVYLKIKGGMFKSRAQLSHYIKDNNLMK
ncbi:MAG: 50S ribosomal protein L19e [Candidatus Micrarchaeota archaeon]|nr:50S ribosomal protein L19e [Candidatus Micrarchaeota archaeon]